MTLSRLALAIGLCFSALSVQADSYLRYPTVHGDTVAFTSEGDLWLAPLAGGKATRLTTHPAEETRARISPDGKSVAFTASYEGPLEVYVMPLAGGLPKRVTFEGTRALTLGWTPQGEILFSTINPSGPSRQSVVGAVDPVTLKRRLVPLADATDATLADDGKTLFFTRLGIASTGDNVKKYRGGAAGHLWKFDLSKSDEAVKLVPGFDGSDKQPMWWNGRLYFVSDRDGSDNLWSMLGDGSDLQQLTHHKDWDVRNPSLGDGHIVYQLGADVRDFNIADKSDKTLNVDLVSDHDQQHERLLHNPMEQVTSTNFAPDGQHVAITARGRVALAGLAPLRRVDIAIPEGSRAREAIVSHNGKFVYAICDTSGEQEIWRFAADGSDKAEQLTRDGHGHRVSMTESPDGKWLAHLEKNGKLHLLNVATHHDEVIDESEAAYYETITWSADSKTLLVARSGTARRLNQIALIDMEHRKVHTVTSDKYQSYSPTLSPDGNWLYFLSDRNFQVANGAPWGDRNMGPFFDKRTRVYALALQAGTRFPFQPKDELESAHDAAKDEAKQEETESKGDKSPSKEDDKSKDKDAAKPKHDKSLPAIAWTGLERRLYEVPLAPGNYSDLKTDGKRLYFLEHELGDNGKSVLKSIAIDNNGAPAEVFSPDVIDYDLAHDYKKLFLQKSSPRGSGDLLIVDAGAKAPADISKSVIRVADWTLTQHPRAEWKQIFLDAWRLHRDFLFDAHMRGVEWEAVKAKYLPLLDRVNDRAELNDLIAMMTSEVGTLHSQIVPGDLRTAQDGSTPAFLGAILERSNEGAVVKHIYRSESELVDDRSPLAAPGVDVREGDVITSVNGKSVAEARDISDLLRNQAGQQTLLKLKRGTIEKSVLVLPANLQQQFSLSYSDWEQARRDQVEQFGKSRIGYLHLRAMGPNDIATFAREFYANYDRDGLIIDVRRNNGGNIDSWVIEKLLRRVWSFWAPRDGKPFTNMQETFRGHLVVLADELTYSDGESFTAGIKALELGPIVGKRTSGAGVWLTDRNHLVDKGRARAAENAVFSVKTGEWIVEGVGVSPDIEVENPPHATFMGQDKQLETALKLLDEKLKAAPIAPIKTTPFTPIGEARKPF